MTRQFQGYTHAAFTLSRRRCGAAPYMSSDTPRFTDMRLSPRPFGSRSVVRLEVICLELRPPAGAIRSVRDTAHPFRASGSAPSDQTASLLCGMMYRWVGGASCDQPPWGL